MSRMESRWTSLRYRLEYAGARLLVAASAAWPLRLGSALERLAGDLAAALLPRRRAIAIDNIRKAGLAADTAAARRLARRSFRHFAGLLLETHKARRLLTPGTVAAYASFEAPPETEALLNDPAQGLLVACGHFGNWEVLGPILAFRKRVAAIAQPMKNPLVDRLMQRGFPGAQLQILPKEAGSMMRLVPMLRQGCVLGILIDQYALKRPVLVPFFGRPVCAHRGIALLHFGTRVPIVYAACRRTGFLRFRIRLSEPLRFPATGDREADTRTVLEALHARLEADIRSAPDQYLWSHRRWRPPKPWAFARGKA